MIDTDALKAEHEKIQQRLTVITVKDALNKILEEGLFRPEIEVWAFPKDGNRETLNQINLDCPENSWREKVTLETRIGDSRERVKNNLKQDFINFCRSNNVKPRMPCAPWSDTYSFDVNNADEDCTHEITFDEFNKFAKPYGVSAGNNSELKPMLENVGGDGADTRTNQLHALIWRVRHEIYKDGKGSAQMVWNEIKYRHKGYDNENIIQEVDDDTIYWRSGYGNEQELKRTSLDSLLSRLKESPLFKKNCG